MASIRPELIRIAARQVRIWRNFPPSGARPNLFLLHGGMGDAQWHWHTVWETLGDSFNVAAPDLPRFGSTGDLPNASLSELVEWLARVQELAGMSQAAFVGHSFGAGLARLYAAAHPERVTHLILVDGGQLPRLPQVVRGLIGLPFFTPLFERTGLLTFSKQGIQRAFANPALVTPEVIANAGESSRAFVSLLRQITLSDVPEKRSPTVPTLLIWGEKDKIAPLERTDEIATDIPTAELAVIKNAGHLPQLEDPTSFVTILRKFCLAPTQPSA